jgi:hypothetical protein
MKNRNGWSAWKVAGGGFEPHPPPPLVAAAGHVEQITRREYQQPAGPTVTFQVDPRLNWWQDGAVPLLP